MSSTERPSGAAPDMDHFEDIYLALQQLNYSIRLPHTFSNNYLQLGPDHSTQLFLAEAFRKYHRFFCFNWGLQLLRSALSRCFHHTDIMGMLDVGLMHIISPEQLALLLFHSHVVPAPLDVEMLRRVNFPEYIRSLSSNIYTNRNNNNNNAFSSSSSSSFDTPQLMATLLPQHTSMQIQPSIHISQRLPSFQQLYRLLHDYNKHKLMQFSTALNIPSLFTSDTNGTSSFHQLQAFTARYHHNHNHPNQHLQQQHHQSSDHRIQQEQQQQQQPIPDDIPLQSLRITSEQTHGGGEFSEAVSPVGFGFYSPGPHCDIVPNCCTTNSHDESTSYHHHQQQQSQQKQQSQQQPHLQPQQPQPELSWSSCSDRDNDTEPIVHQSEPEIVSNDAIQSSPSLIQSPTKLTKNLSRELSNHQSRAFKSTVLLASSLLSEPPCQSCHGDGHQTTSTNPSLPLAQAVVSLPSSPSSSSSSSSSSSKTAPTRDNCMPFRKTEETHQLTSSQTQCREGQCSETQYGTILIPPSTSTQMNESTLPSNSDKIVTIAPPVSSSLMPSSRYGAVQYLQTVLQHNDNNMIEIQTNNHNNYSFDDNIDYQQQAKQQQQQAYQQQQQTSQQPSFLSSLLPSSWNVFSWWSQNDNTTNKQHQQYTSPLHHQPYSLSYQQLSSPFDPSGGDRGLGGLDDEIEAQPLMQFSRRDYANKQTTIDPNQVEFGSYIPSQQQQQQQTQTQTTKKQTQQQLSSSSPNVIDKSGTYRGIFGSLLDVGAGNGRTASLLRPLFRQIECTEVSKPMIDTIRRAGFIAYHTDNIDTLPYGNRYDVICLFNLIDRMDTPITLLQTLHERLSYQLPNELERYKKKLEFSLQQTTDAKIVQEYLNHSHNTLFHAHSGENNTIHIGNNNNMKVSDISQEKKHEDREMFTNILQNDPDILSVANPNETNAILYEMATSAQNDSRPLTSLLLSTTSQFAQNRLVSSSLHPSEHNDNGDDDNDGDDDLVLPNVDNVLSSGSHTTQSASPRTSQHNLEQPQQEPQQKLQEKQEQQEQQQPQEPQEPQEPSNNTCQDNPQSSTPPKPRTDLEELWAHQFHQTASQTADSLPLLSSFAATVVPPAATGRISSSKSPTTLSTQQPPTISKLTSPQQSLSPLQQLKPVEIPSHLVSSSTTTKNTLPYSNPNGRLVIATPLPLRPSVETTLSGDSNNKSWRAPIEDISLPNTCSCCVSFEESLQHLICNVIDPCGYDVLTVSRLPYLSEGNLYNPFFVLEDVILVCAPKVTTSSELSGANRI